MLELLPPHRCCAITCSQCTPEQCSNGTLVPENGARFWAGFWARFLIQFFRFVSSRLACFSLSVTTILMLFLECWMLSRAALLWAAFRSRVLICARSLYQRICFSFFLSGRRLSVFFTGASAKCLRAVVPLLPHRHWLRQCCSRHLPHGPLKKTGVCTMHSSGGTVLEPRLRLRT